MYSFVALFYGLCMFVYSDVFTGCSVI